MGVRLVIRARGSPLATAPRPFPFCVFDGDLSTELHSEAEL